MMAKTRKTNLGVGKRDKALHLEGFITEKNAREIEKNLPGISNFYVHSNPKPKTFLELEWAYMCSRTVH